MRSVLKSAYQKSLSLLPEYPAAVVSDVAFTVSRRPLVYRDARQHMGMGRRRATITFSIDFEMAWATQYAPYSPEDCVTMGLRERTQVPIILRNFDNFSIPATWATVGHLFLKECARGSNGLAHSEMPRCSHFNNLWEFTSGDWYQHDPCTDFRRNPAWYAPDLIENIASSKSRHELACHGFSHIGFGPYCPDHVVAAELDACIEVMKPYGLRPTSLIFPGNHLGKLDVIAAKGFKSIRAFPVTWAEISLPLRHETGLWWVLGSVDIDIASGAINLHKRLDRLKKYVQRAIQSQMNAHFWFHPSMPLVQLETMLFPLLRYCADMREKGEIDILTMEGLVAETERLMARDQALR